MKSIRTFIVALGVVMAAAFVVMPTFAQDNTATPAPSTSNTAKPHRGGGLVSGITLTITQEDINNHISKLPGKVVSDVSVKLGDGQVTVAFTTKALKNTEAAKAIVAVVTPGAADGKVTWTLTSLTIDGTAATQAQIDQFKQRVADLIGGKLKQYQRRFSVDSVTVTPSAMTISLSRKTNV